MIWKCTFSLLWKIQLTLTKEQNIKYNPAKVITATVRGSATELLESLAQCIIFLLLQKLRDNLILCEEKGALTGSQELSWACGLSPERRYVLPDGSMQRAEGGGGEHGP